MSQGQLARVVVFGGGGHAHVVCDVLERAGFEIVGCVDPVARMLVNAPRVSSDREGVAMARDAAAAAFVAIGDNQARARVLHLVTDAGLPVATAVDPTATVGKARIGVGCSVHQHAHVGPGAKVGVGCVINTGAVIEHGAVVGDFTHVAPGAVVLGEAVLGEGSLIGARAVVLPGVVVGAGAVVGAGSVVVRSVPVGVSVVGVPARPLQ